MTISYNTGTAEYVATPATTATLTIPAGVLPGDLMILAAGTSYGAASFTVSSAGTAFTQIGTTQTYTSYYGFSFALFYAIAASADPGATVTFTAGSNSSWMAVLGSYTGAGGIDVSGLNYSPATGAASTPSVTTTDTGDWALQVYMASTASTAPTAPSGQTERANASLSGDGFWVALFDSDATVAASTVIGGSSLYASSTAGYVTFAGTLGITSGTPPPASPVFSPVDYGATGGGIVVMDGAMTASSANLACTTSTPFTSAMTGWPVIVNGALGAGSALTAHISTFTDSGHVVLDTAASATVSGAAVLFGPDQTDAFQDAIDAAATYAGTYGGAEVHRPFPPPSGLFWMIDGALVNTSNANSQLTLPDVSGTVMKPSLRFTADLPTGNLVPLWSQAIPQVAGALVSTGKFASSGAYATNYNTYGRAAVIGSTPALVSDDSEIGGFGAFSNIDVVIDNWSIVTPSSANGLNLAAFNLAGCATGGYSECGALITTNYYVSSGANQFPAVGELQNGPACGFGLPGNGNNDKAYADNCTISGYAFGFGCGEHSIISGRVVFCWAAAELFGNDGLASEHWLRAVLSVEGCDQGIWVVGGGAEGAGFFIEADLDIEGISAHGLIADNNTGGGIGTLFGEIRCYGSYGLNIFPTLYPTSVKLISKGPAFAGIIPGWTFAYGGFSTAGTGVAVQNPYWRDVEVAFSGGSVTAVGAGVTLGGSGGSATTAPAMTATGLSGTGTVPWPSGGWLSFTFTGSPVWNVCVPS